MTGRPLSLSAAARAFGLNRGTLRGAIEAGTIRAARTDVAGAVRYAIDAHELAEDLARLPTCRHPGCERRALGPSGGCEAHGHALAGAMAAGVPRSAETRARIGASKRGTARPDAAQRMAAIAEQRRGELAQLAGGPGLVDAREAARLLGISRNSLGHFVRTGSLTPQRVQLPGEPRARLLFERDQVLELADRPSMRDRIRDDFRTGGPSAQALWPTWGGAARRRHAGAWAGRRAAPAGGHAKGAQDGREVAEAALEILARHGSAPRRRALVDALIRLFEGSNALDLPDGGGRREGRDPVYRAARARIVRRLARGYEILGRPAALEGFVEGASVHRCTDAPSVCTDAPSGGRSQLTIGPHEHPADRPRTRRDPDRG